MNWLPDLIWTALTNYHRLGDLQHFFLTFPKTGKSKSSLMEDSTYGKTCSLLHRHPSSVTSHARARSKRGHLLSRALTPITSQSPHVWFRHLRLGFPHLNLGGRGTNTESIAPIHMKCLVCLKKFSACWQLFHFVILSTTFVGPSSSDGEIQFLPSQIPSYLDWLLPRAKVWAELYLHSQLFNPLFNQSVKISQFTQKDSMGVYFMQEWTRLTDL